MCVTKIYQYSEQSQPKTLHFIKCVARIFHFKFLYENKIYSLLLRYTLYVVFDGNFVAVDGNFVAVNGNFVAID